jgi:formate dehydrogenase assembly factor FdhD
MKRKRLFLSGIAAVLICGGAVLAQVGVDVDGHKHPNLAAAQQHIQEAYAKLDEAQNIYHDKLGDHAQKAKDLLTQANREIKAAAEYADQHK